MAVSVSNATIVNLFKKVYGDITNLVPQGFPLIESVKYSQKARLGESYNEAVILSNEVGWTLGGSAGDVFDINSAVAGSVQQATIPAYVSVLRSQVPWSVLSRSAGGGERAFIDGTKHVVQNNVRSHMGLIETLALHGRSSVGLGTPSYFTGTYRGASFTAGAGTLGGITFATGGVNTTTKNFLVAPGQFASGIWVGREGAVVKEVLVSSGAVVAQGNLVSVDSENGILTVDFTPVAASSANSHKLVFEGMELSNEMYGAKAILQNTGSLFGISGSSYSLWRGTTVALSSTLLTFARLQSAAAQAMNRGGLEQDVVVMCNPRSFASLVNAEAARRMYDQSYGKAEFDNGAEAITFYYAGGKMVVKPSRYVMEGEAYGLCLEDWVRSGSSEISLKVPGLDKELIFPAENSSAHIFQSYSDQYLFCRRPAAQFLITGIDDSAAS
jgi:hypothetical protein